jgi:hypothetical protein
LATLENEAETYKKMISQPVNKDELLRNLAELEELGLIRNKIIGTQDKPIYIWETQF